MYCILQAQFLFETAIIYNILITIKIYNYILLYIDCKYFGLIKINDTFQ